MSDLSPAGSGSALRRKARLAAYQELRAERPQLFDNPPHAAFEILLDEADQLAVADAAEADYRAAGIPPDCADIGVVYRDRFIIVLRDAVRFRSGERGPYVRIMPAANGVGAATLPVLPDGRVMLGWQFRHQTRRWHWEIPRGFGEDGEAGVQTATRELVEEFRVSVASIEYLGTINEDALYLARVTGAGTPETAEGIDAIKLVTPGELAELIRTDQIHDPYTLAAVSLAAARGLIPFPSYPHGGDGG